MAIDILLVETGDGNEFVQKGNDFITVEGMQNVVYLSLFGGNVEGSTREIIGQEQRMYWWANDALYQEDIDEQMNSETERKLQTIALNSQGRLELIQSIKTDLAWIEEFAEVEADVIFESVDRVRISVTLTQPSNEENTSFVFLWDSTKQELLNGNNYNTI